MKHFLFLISLSWAVNSAAAELCVYTYDSLVGKGTLGEALSLALKKSSIEIKWVTFPSAGEALNQIALEGKKTRADILLGIDELQLERAKSLNLFASLPQELFKDLNPGLKTSELFLPFDYGYLAFVYDSSRPTLPALPTLLSLAQNPALRKKIIIEDPRTSSLGLGFLTWVQASLGDKAGSFWNELTPQLRTVAPSWSGAYGLFLKGEADLVLSYTTSPAYHLMMEKKDQYRALLFAAGHFRQVEGALKLSHSRLQKEGAAFLSALVSESLQKQVPTLQWMYPVRKGVALPEAFAKLPVPEPFLVDKKAFTEHKEAWIQNWIASLASVNKSP